MAHNVARPSAAGPVFLWGLVCGGILAVVDVLLYFVPSLARLGRQSLGVVSPFTGAQIAFWVANLIALILCCVAGVLTARTTRTVPSGAMAGLIARLLSGLVSFVLVATTLARLPRVIISSPGSAQFLIVTLVQDLIILVVASAICASVAALGALIGRGFATSKPMAPYAPYTAPVGYPSPAGYAPYAPTPAAPGGYQPPASYVPPGYPRVGSPPPPVPPAPQV
jgi:hypothetical protein